jgi:hypothetical protein
MSTRGAVKKKRTEATYICCSAKTKAVTFLYFIFIFIFIDFFNALFGRFVTKEFKNTKKNFFRRKSIGAHHKKIWLFFRPFFFFFFLPQLFGSIFLSRFWAFRNKGSSKTRLKKIPRKSSQLPKKVGYLLTSMGLDVYLIYFRGTDFLPTSKKKKPPALFLVFLGVSREEGFKFRRTPELHYTQKPTKGICFWPGT